MEINITGLFIWVLLSILSGRSHMYQWANVCQSTIRANWVQLWYDAIESTGSRIVTSVTGMNIIGLALQAVMRRRGNGIAMSVLKVQKYP